MLICHFEDHAVADLEPLTLTRPVFELLCGCTTLGAKQSSYFSCAAAGAIVRPYLAGLLAEQRPDLPVNDTSWMRRGPVVMVNGRWLPPEGNFDSSGIDIKSFVGTVGHEIAYAFLSPEQITGCSPDTLDDFLDGWARTLPRREAGGTLVARAWDLVQHNAEEISRDLRRSGGDPRGGFRPLDMTLVGPASGLVIDPSVRLEPMVVADTTNGPVILHRDVSVSAFTRLEGPCFIGSGSQLRGAKIRSGTTIGRCCRIGGEVEASIVHGFTNKYHEGFLGHSYVGEWVNIGAGAQTSDLRNDYGEVIVTVGGTPVPTGQSKAGSYIGDHTKIGLGSLLNTGSNIGVFASMLPAGKLLPRYVPSFCAVSHGVLAVNNDTEMLFATAEEVMRRRGVRMSETQHEVYRRVYDETGLHRKQALRELDPRKHLRVA